MGLLDKLWDETLAGPTPESGLGILRKHNSFSASLTAAAPPPPSTDGQTVPVSRSITAPRDIPKRNLRVSVDSPSDPSSPSGSGDPSSPFSPCTPGSNLKRMARRKSTSAALPNSYSKSPSGYDWIVLSALER
ncbi:hypothetical protein ABFS82_04G091200 [Erythranthe guttata]|uniref:Uncharacterized protein n=1 Tax=Erythranthe guttata TaxID=4155 RepID=A0A022S201_ERYGU|nr:PREDICTED: auxin-repressed 12.5 kDa protein-like [Erythranthe guttata]EYU45908.1 hypothetical protein MIMGU_mgv1a016024mg [Erythranthe guttata]|eukprot:XP_012832287.1 PREDICTED: auxin-repressed 12.5 kDa protein-like [Erythranthe guttata]